MSLGCQITHLAFRLASRHTSQAPKPRAQHAYELPDCPCDSPVAVVRSTSHIISPPPPCQPPVPCSHQGLRQPPRLYFVCHKRTCLEAHTSPKTRSHSFPVFSYSNTTFQFRKHASGQPKMPLPPPSDVELLATESGNPVLGSKRPRSYIRWSHNFGFLEGSDLIQNASSHTRRSSLTPTIHKMTWYRVLG